MMMAFLSGKLTKNKKNNNSNFVNLEPTFDKVSILSGAPNDSFLSDPLKRYFRLSGVPLKLCGFILGRAIIFLSVRSF